MRLTLTRDLFTPTATLGALFIDGKPFGWTCEDVDRGLDATMSLADIAARKVHGQTAIPTGHYKVGIRFSPHFQRDVLWILNVPGYELVYAHEGNDPEQTDGCLLVGTQRDPAAMTVGHSRAAIDWLEHDPAGPMACIRAGGEVWIDVGRDGAAWGRRVA